MQTRSTSTNQVPDPVADPTPAAGTVAASVAMFAPKPTLQALPVLSSTNFRQWRIVLGAHLACFGLDHLLDPTAVATPEQQKQARSYVIGSLSEHDYPHIEGKTTLYELIEALRTARHGKIEQHQVQLASQLLSLRIAPGESISEFCNKMRGYCNQLEDAGVPFGDLLLAVWTLTCARLDARFTAQCDIMLGLGVKLTMDHVQAALKSVEHAGEMQVPSATGLAASGGAKPKASEDPSALAALAKRVNQLSSTLGQLKKGASGSGPQRAAHQQPVQRTRPYHQPSSSNGGGSFRCLNCKGFNHSYKVCKKPCQACGRHGHSAHLCRTNPPNDPNRRHAARAHFSASEQDPDREEHHPTAHAYTHVGLPAPSILPPGFRNGKSFSYRHTTRGRAYSAANPRRTGMFDWVLDSGATHHMTYCKDLLHDFVPSFRKNDVKVAADVFLDRVGYGTLRFETVIHGVKHSGEIRNVWYVPDLTETLISNNQLKDEGYMIVGGGDGSKDDYIFDRDGTLIIHCPFQNGLNVPEWTLIPVNNHTPSVPPTDPKVPALFSACDVDESSGYCCYTSANHASDPETPELWHQRLGHVNYQSLYTLVSKNLVTGVTLHPSAFRKCHNHVCDVCVMAKHRRASFKPREERADELLHTLHSDVVVLSVPSVEGCRYAVTLLDEWSNYAVVHVLRNKYQVEELLKATIVEWENHVGKRCKFLFTDRGGEYLSDAFKRWCASRGLKHDKSVPRTPQLNGKAERFNQTLFDHVRSMLLHYNLPQTLWSHAVLYAASIHNVTLNKRLQITPYQAFRKKIPNITNFRTFGCKVFARAPETTRKKLDAKSVLGIYLGPCNDGPGHKVLVYTPDAKRNLKYAVNIYRDVVTFESLTDVCGVQTSSALQWGGPIKLPIRHITAPQAQEPMSGAALEKGTTPLTVPQLQLLLADHLGKNVDSRDTAVTQLPMNQSVQNRVVHFADPPSASNADVQPMRAQGRDNNTTHVPLLQNVPHSQDEHRTRDVASSTHKQSADARSRYPQRKRKPASWYQGGSANTPADYATIAHFASTIPQAAVFNTQGNLDANVDQPALVTCIDVSSNRIVKKSKQSNPCLTPYVHIAVAMPTPAPAPTLSDVHKYNVPTSVKEALNGPYAKYWLEALQSEFASLQENGTWLLVERTPDMNVLSGKWLFKIKTNANGVPVRFKSRWVAGGHKQIEGVDFWETYASTARMDTLRTFLAVAAHLGWEIEQVDISTAFLNGDIDVEVYVQQPHGFCEGRNLVCKLRKSLYGLKQAPRIWYETLKKALLQLGFRPSAADSSFWVKDGPDGAIVYLTTVVDDMLIAARDVAHVRNIINSLLRIFKGTHGGIAHHYSGFKITRIAHRGVLLTQESHVKDMLHKFELLHDDWSPRSLPIAADIKLTENGILGQPDSPLLDVTHFPYRSLIGGMSYVACCTRPDIAYAVNQLARFNNAPTVAHWRIGINCLRYLAGTPRWGILLGTHNEPVQAFVDSSHGTGTPDGKSVTGFVSQVYGGAVAWSSRTQQLVCTSSTESEYRAMSECAKHALWMCKLLTELRVPHVPYPIYGDNKGAIDAVSGYAHTKHTKHIELHLDFMRQRRELGQLVFKRIPGADNPADMLTKPLPKQQLARFRSMIGMMELPMDS